MDITIDVASADPGSDPDLPLLYVDISAIDNENLRIRDPKRLLGREAPSRARRPVRDGDVLFSNVRTYLKNIARVEGLGERSFASTGFTVLRPRDGIDSSYLFRLVASDAFVDAVTPEQTGSQYPATSDRVVRGQVVPVAPAAEQSRIAQRIDQIEARKESTEGHLDAARTSLDRFRKSVLASAFSGRLTADWRAEFPNLRRPSLRRTAEAESRASRRKAKVHGDGPVDVSGLPELPTSWGYERAEEIVELGTAITYGIVLPGPEIADGVPYVRQQDVANGTVLVEQLRRTSHEIADKHHRSALLEGDVLLCIIRNLRVAIVPPGIDGANITQGMVRLRPAEVVHPPYLAAYLENPYIQQWMMARYVGLAMPRINVADARAIPVALPSIEEQREIVRRVSAMLSLAEEVAKRVDSASRSLLRCSQAVSVKAFRGQLVQTEAELAHHQGREYESAMALLKRASAGARTRGPVSQRAHRSRVV
ncbi:restriction endonuclease subunit S [Micromonospora sp. D93]|uniref:restriction endonuclease subunit S n=1 Tax=Micromonospora sp. D93 TaxID=2824886 RepID=UPI001B395673|nr:restriction endonuclease subunit S [Micromonospora sp. D93]MBQ1021883.1 restriction endonuclease subunit S [Micromonospora sp. D93]